MNYFYYTKREMNATPAEVTFVPLTAHDGYEISTTPPHIIRRIDTGKINAQSITNSGYYQITIAGRTYPVHRIIAQQFIPNEDPEHLTDVNHINHNKTDNRIENLEWITHAANLAHRKSFKKQRSEYVTELNPETTIRVNEYENLKLPRYYFDTATSMLLLQQKNNKYKIVKPSRTDKYNIVALIADDGKIKSRAYDKLIRTLQSRIE